MTKEVEVGQAVTHNRSRELRNLLIGYGIALVLTLLAFGTVVLDFPRTLAVVIILVLGFIQVIMQMWYFLHLDLEKSHRDDLQLATFTSILGATMFLGTLWIIFNQMKLMG